MSKIKKSEPGLKGLKDKQDLKKKKTAHHNLVHLGNPVNHGADKKGYKHTSIGWIPEDWQVVKINHFVKSLEAGVSVNSEDLPALFPELGVLKTSAVSNCKFNSEENKRIINKDIKRARLNPKKGAIIISRMNTPELVGLNAYVDKDYNNLFLPDRLWQTTFKEEVKLNSKWLAYVLSWKRNLKRIRDLATGTSNSMKNISKEAFLELEISVCPLKDQQKIAQILSTWDNAIEKMEKLIAAKEKLKKGLMQQLLTGKKRFKEFRNDKWEKVKMEEVVKVIDGTHSTPKYINSGIPFLRVTDIQDSNIDLSKCKYISKEEHKELIKRCNPKVGDILYSKNGTIGITKLIDWDWEFSIFVSLALLSIKDRKILDSHYLCNFLRSDIIKKEIYKGSKQGGGVINLHLEEIRKFKFSLPKLKEQKQISLALDTFEQEIEKLKIGLQAIKNQKKGLMQQLLSGKKRVKV